MKRTLPVDVTDSAVLRWLELIERFDIDDLRAQIAEYGAIGCEMGAKTVVVGAGKLVLADNRVITVLRRGDYRSTLMGSLQVEIAGEIEIYVRPKRRRRR
jgi:acyl CoA:acetate/3-ketoacid CoA transferase beta subunit